MSETIIYILFYWISQKKQASSIDYCIIISSQCKPNNENLKQWLSTMATEQATYGLSKLSKGVGYRLMAKTEKQGHNSGSYLNVTKHLKNIFKISDSHQLQKVILECQETNELSPQWPQFTAAKEFPGKEKKSRLNLIVGLFELRYCCWESSKSGSSS